MSNFRWWKEFAVFTLGVIGVGVSVNALSEIIPQGWQVVLIACAVLLIAGGMHLHVKRKEEREREERDRQEREREEREQRERAERVRVREVLVVKLKRQPGVFNFLLAPWIAENTPEYRAVDAAMNKALEEFRSACEQHGVNPGQSNWFHDKAAQSLFEATGDDRWVTVGRNVENLYSKAAAIYAEHERGLGETYNKPAMAPTAETARAFVEVAQSVVQQIQSLRRSGSA
ncbi:hypothetical protein ACFYN9_26195 [Streptomyces collinus]|uniref:hypothetical protein n=1 Tax=Streptomyces collinus TaxID=42684 RepID=UPI0036D1EB84